MFRAIPQLLQHIIKYLEDDTLEVFGGEYCQILLTHILPVSGYCHLISKQNLNGKYRAASFYILTLKLFLELIKICIVKLRKSLQQSAVHFDPHTYSRVLCTLIQSYPLDLTKLFPTLTDFFDQFFSNYGFVKKCFLKKELET